MTSASSIAATDARGKALTLSVPPRRVVSLVPSQTELLAYLGLNDAVVGLTRFCVHPEDWQRRKQIVGGTKQVNVERVAALRPDLILANREENTQEMVEALEALAPVFVTDVSTVPDALAMIRTVGDLMGRSKAAAALAREIEVRFDAVPASAPLRTAYLIWQNPLMTVGRDTFIHDVMQRSGLMNVFGDRTRYPEISADDLRAAAPDVLLLPSEPYPFTEAHLDTYRGLVSGTAVQLVDGEPFSWYGSRLLHTPAYLRCLRAELATVRSS